jgi:hypothetical protein
MAGYTKHKERMASDPDYAEEFRARRRLANKKYAQSPKGRATTKRMNDKRKEVKVVWEREKYLSDPDYRSKRKAKNAQWRKSNPDKRRAQLRRHMAKDATRARRRAYLNGRYGSDIQYKMAVTLRNRLNEVVGERRPSSALKLVGCSLNTLKAHIEKQWLEGMSWGNWTLAGWHIDHIKPLASFDLTDPQQCAAACHYTNLQPLWAAENLRKGARAEAA